MNEFEKHLQNHAKRIKDTMKTPFDIETEEFTMTNKSFSMKKTIILAAAIICLVGTTVFAAYHYLSAEDVANKLGETEMAQLFDGQGYVSETITDGKYSATMLGITTGENLNNFESSNWDVIDERTYAVVAVEKSDGTAMTIDDEVMATPLIAGQKPWECNIFTLAGGHSEKIIDGILYRIVEFNNIEYFADRTVYMAIYEGFAPSAEIFEINPDGTIEYNEDYSGAKALFEIPLDKSKADSKKAAELLEQMWADDEDNVPGESTSENESAEWKEVTIKPDLSVTEESIVLEKAE